MHWTQRHTTDLASRSLVAVDLQQRLLDLWFRSALGWSFTLRRERMTFWTPLWSAAPSDVPAVPDLHNDNRAAGTGSVLGQDAQTYVGP